MNQQNQQQQIILNIKQNVTEWAKQKKFKTVNQNKIRPTKFPLQYKLYKKYINSIIEEKNK